jgi:hypothetical protein
MKQHYNERLPELDEKHWNWPLIENVHCTKKLK